MRTALAISVGLMVIGCQGESPSVPISGPIQTPGESRRENNQEVPVRRVFGIASDFSGKLTKEDEEAAPETLHGAFYIESVKQITATELEKELEFKTLVAEEEHDGNRYVALKDFRHVEFSNEVSGQMIVIERYLVVPN